MALRRKYLFCRKTNTYSTERLFGLIRNGAEIRDLFQKHIDINTRDYRGETVMHHASRSGYLKIVICLVEEGADTDLKNSKGFTPLICAAEASQKRVVDILLNSANVDGDEGRLLYYASCNGWTKIVKTFVRRVPDLSKKYWRGYTALHIASIKGNLDVVKCLVKGGIDINARNCINNTAFHSAANAGQLAIVKWFVEKKLFDINARNGSGGIVLHYASLNGDLEMVKYLIKEGSDIDVINSIGDTPLLFAAKENRKNVVNWLVCSGANINISDRKKRTVLHYASQHGCLETVQFLVNRECDLDARNWNMVTALCIACVYHHLDIVQYLLQAGASWEVLDINHSSPLDYLTKEEIIIMFIENGVHVKPVDYYLILKRFALEVLQDVKLCSQAIVSRFNNYDLPELYKLPVYKSLPHMEKIQIVSNRGVALEIEKTVEFEIQTKGHCNLLEVSPLPLSVLSVKSVLEYYEKNACKLQNKWKRSAAFDSDDKYQHSNKAMRLS